jgi:hypothetical protein
VTHVSCSSANGGDPCCRGRSRGRELAGRGVLVVPDGYRRLPDDLTLEARLPPHNNGR